MEAHTGSLSVVAIGNCAFIISVALCQTLCRVLYFHALSQLIFTKLYEAVTNYYYFHFTDKEMKFTSEIICSKSRWQGRATPTRIRKTLKEWGGRKPWAKGASGFPDLTVPMVLSWMTCPQILCQFCHTRPRLKLCMARMMLSPFCSASPLLHFQPDLQVVKHSLLL